MDRTEPPARSRMYDLLKADGPHPDYVQHMGLFAPFIGDWAFDFSWFSPSGRINGTGSWHFDWALQGRAIIDVWIATPNEGPYDGEWGATLRYPVPEKGVWHVAWMGPMRRTRTLLTARPDGDRIVLEGRDEDGSLLNWVFSNIEKNSFIWRNLSSTDSGKTWTPRTEMSLRRS
jgi:hypothetical protein